jgi:hypothetical protein
VTSTSSPAPTGTCVSEPAKFSFQFILNDGAEEYVLRPTVQDAEVIRDPIKDADELFFDIERRVLILRDID